MLNGAGQLLATHVTAWLAGNEPVDLIEPVSVAVDSSETIAVLDASHRGVVASASYEARKFGVHSAMPIAEAKRRCPKGVFLPVRMQRYKEISRTVFALFERYTPLVEPLSIDEAFLDVSGCRRLFGSPPEIAAAIKRDVHRDLGLTVSAGVAANKSVAKIASDYRKPDGLTVISPQDIAGRIWQLPARRINGVGPKAAAKLARLGIATIGELAAAEPQWLVRHFGGTYGRWLHAAALGRDERPVITASEPKSISRETTFERDLHAVRDRAALSAIFTELCLRVADDLRRKRYAGRTIGVKLRFDDFRTVTRDSTLAAATDDAAAIRRAAGLCLKRIDLSRRIRLLGVRVGALERGGGGSNGSPPPRPAQGEADLFDGATG